jgi:hypothetical protein
MLLLLRSDPLVPVSPFFIVEVINSKQSHQNMLAHKSNKEPEAPAQNRRNRYVRFHKPDPPVLSILATVRGAAGINEEALPPTL